MIVRKGLVEGRTFPRLAAHLAEFLATTLFHTSLLALPSDQLRCVRSAAAAPGRPDVLLLPLPAAAVHPHRPC